VGEGEEPPSPCFTTAIGGRQVLKATASSP